MPASRLIKGFIKGPLALWFRKTGGDENAYDYTIGIEGPEGTATITYPAFSDASAAWHRAIARVRQGQGHPRDVLEIEQGFERDNPHGWR